MSGFSEVCTQSVHFFFQILSLLHNRRVHGENPGCTVLGEVGAQKKTLISDTVQSASTPPKMFIQTK